MDSLAILVHPVQRAVLATQENEVYQDLKEGVASRVSPVNQEQLEQMYVLQQGVFYGEREGCGIGVMIERERK